MKQMNESVFKGFQEEITTVLLNKLLNSNGNGCSTVLTDRPSSDDRVHSMLEEDNRNVSPSMDVNEFPLINPYNEWTNDSNSAEDFH